MFDAMAAFDRYRLEVVKTWPEGEEKEALIAAIEASLLRSGRREEPLVQSEAKGDDSLQHCSR